MSVLSLDCRSRAGGFVLDLVGEIPCAGITAIFGPSGAGKTSLLRLVAGLDRPADGEIRYGEETWAAPGRFVPAHRRRIGFVFQEDRLFDHLSVLGNLRYGACRAARNARGPDRDEVIGAMGLGPLLARRPETLSGGERQRVAIGRALLTCPRLLLMDEPVSALDRERREDILSLIEGLPHRFGLPVLYVSHALAEVARLAGTTVLVEAGQIAGIGPTTVLLGAGSGRGGPFVLKGQTIGRTNGLVEMAVGGGRLRLATAGEVRPGEARRILLDPSDIAIATAPPRHISIRNVLAARILALAPAGDALVDVTMQAGSETIAARITRAAAAALDLRPDLEVYALVKTARLVG